ncbi:Uu.00g093580.m01.CDS01 [Anthostomella pinea]|uniref:Uu.00g093580.m01.CDS01 n=1 Tax=Anthostomella pinea TaxID=933095 RepID=A0AAI8VP65_9PEZI|nr:Uu.00g093580.m01.CDS01 [Anthostomella pinea]
MADEEVSSPLMTPYIYVPLSADAQTRILEIQPSLDPSALVRCMLRDIDIMSEEESGFDALSYI